MTHERINAQGVVATEAKDDEQELRVNSEERLNEACLFIDPVYLSVAALRGDKHPEDIFGAESLDDWIKAREYLVDQEGLSHDILNQVNRIVNPQGTYLIQGTTYRTEDMRSYDYSDGVKLLELTQEQKVNIENNPLLVFRTVGEDPNIGYIVHPSFMDDSSFEKCSKSLPTKTVEGLVTLREETMRIRAEIVGYMQNPGQVPKATLQELDKKYERMIGQGQQELIKNLLDTHILEWLHQPLYGSKTPWSTPSKLDSSLEYKEKIEIAAQLQRRFVSIHPFNDGNGRSSRAIMNWYLEKVGLNGAMIERNDIDLTLSESEWELEVDNGVERYGEILHERNKGLSLREKLFPLDELIFYDEVVSQEYPAPEETRDHDMCHAYLDFFYDRRSWIKVKGLGRTRERIKYDSDVKTRKYGFDESGKGYFAEKQDQGRDSGGLIPEGFYKNAFDTRPEAQAVIREKYYLPDREVFRGGTLPRKNIEDPHDFLKMFTGVPSFNAGYRVITAQNMNGDTLKSVDLLQVEQTMIDYNELLLHDYEQRTSLTPLPSPKQLPQREQTLSERVSRIPGRDSLIAKALLKRYKEGAYLRGLLQAHTLGITDGPKYINYDFWMSPGVSVTEDLSTAEHFSNPNTNQGKVGVLMKVALPRYGKIYTPGASDIKVMQDPKDGEGPYAVDPEQEWVIMGAISPNSVNEVMVKIDDTIITITRDQTTNAVYYEDQLKKEREVYEFQIDGKLKLIRTEKISDEKGAPTQSPRRAFIGNHIIEI